MKFKNQNIKLNFKTAIQVISTLIALVIYALPPTKFAPANCIKVLQLLFTTST